MLPRRWDELSIAGKAEMVMDGFGLSADEEQAVTTEWSLGEYEETEDGEKRSLQDLTNLAQAKVLSRNDYIRPRPSVTEDQAIGMFSAGD